MTAAGKPFFVILPLLILNSAFAYGQLMRYHSKEGKFSISFPAEYAESEQEYDKGRMINVTAAKDDNVFWVNFTIFKNGVEGNELILAKEALDNFVLEQGCSLESKRENLFLGHKCMDAMLKTADGVTNIYFRVFFVGNIRYELAVISSRDLAGTSGKFFQSFALD